VVSKGDGATEKKKAQIYTFNLSTPSQIISLQFQQSLVGLKKKKKKGINLKGEYV
jgi:hypothetical protein